MDPDIRAAIAVGICTDVDEAAGRSAAGVDVVLVLPQGASLGPGGRGPGRVAIFVVGTGEDADQASVTAMGAELFGPPLP